MVSYWKSKESVEAKITQNKEGHYEMFMDGEKYPFPGYPRGSLLYGHLSYLKHMVKNKIFNDMWAMLEDKKSNEEIMQYIRTDALPTLFEILDKQRYDMVPPEKMVPAVKEVYRALSAIEGDNENIRKCKEIITFVLQEDDAYRFRFQWAMKFFKYKFLRKNYIEVFDYALSMIEHAEIVGDMKERQRLFRRGMMTVLKDPQVKQHFENFMKELDWNKVKLSKADKYFFRAKYFKVDYPEYEY